MLNSLDDIKAATQQGDSDRQWFTPDTLKWWHTRLCTTVWPVTDGAYFVASNRPVRFHMDGSSAPRTYTVHFCSDAGSIDTVGGYGEHATLREAKMHARAAADVHHMPRPADA